jgi:hypothetical protein
MQNLCGIALIVVKTRLRQKLFFTSGLERPAEAPELLL